MDVLNQLNKEAQERSQSDLGVEAGNMGIDHILNGKELWQWLQDTTGTHEELADDLSSQVGVNVTLEEIQNLLDRLVV